MIPVSRRVALNKRQSAKKAGLGSINGQILRCQVDVLRIAEAFPMNLPLTILCFRIGSNGEKSICNAIRLRTCKSHSGLKITIADLKSICKYRLDDLCLFEDVLYFAACITHGSLSS